jgi:hypothetical protein
MVEHADKLAMSLQVGSVYCAVTVQCYAGYYDSTSP